MPSSTTSDGTVGPSASEDIIYNSDGTIYDPVMESWRQAMQRDLQNSTVDCEALVLYNHNCPADSQIVDKVVSALKDRHAVSHDNLQYRDPGSSESEMKPWPEPDAEYSNHHAPLAWLLNEILTISNELLPPNNFHRDLRFLLYKGKNAPEDDSAGLIAKPELLGYHRSDVDENTVLKWKEAMISVAVDDTWQECVVRSSMYAYCCYASQPTRDFVPAILFKHSSMVVRIGFYSREGLVVTKDLTLTTEEGFSHLVRGIVGFNTWADPNKAGFDMTRTDEEIAIPGEGVYTIVHTYHERPGITGKATRVYKLAKKEEAAGGHDLNCVANLMRDVLVDKIKEIRVAVTTQVGPATI